MSTLFISHSSKDNAIAKEVAKKLVAQHHHSIFLDFDPEKGIVAGQSWEKTLYRKLRACQAVIVICTKNYLNSKWCFAEIALSRMEGKQIFTLLFDSNISISDLPSILTQLQLIKMIDNKEQGYKRLWNGLEEEQLLSSYGEWDTSQPPYLGLASFKEKDAPVFFGRNKESQVGVEVLSRGTPNLIMVLGASGSGKSSLVMAGIIPKLRRIPDQWIIVNPFRPGRDPFGELAASIESAFEQFIELENYPEYSLRQIRKTLLLEAEKNKTNVKDGDSENLVLDQNIKVQLNEQTDQREAIINRLTRELRQSSNNQRNATVLLVIDQFEELLGFDDMNDSHNLFLKMIRNSIETKDSNLMILTSMRSDFLEEFQRSEMLRGLDYESLSLGPMPNEKIREIIEKPAKLGAISLEDGLSDRLIYDTGSADALPLLSFTLWKLWKDHHKDGLLEISEYDKIGGLSGAIVKEAESVMKLTSDPLQRDAVQRVFLKMARLNDEGEYSRVSLSMDDPDILFAKDLIDQFIKRRLLYTDSTDEETVIEVAHESLFRSWTQLKDWLDSHRSELRLRQLLRRDVKSWIEEGRSADRLWAGSRLENVKELRLNSSLLKDEEAFIKMAIKKKNRKLKRTILTVAIVFISLIGISAFAFLQAINANKQTRQTNHQLSLNLWKDAQEARNNGDHYKALMLVSEAIDLNVEKSTGLDMSMDFRYSFYNYHPLKNIIQSNGDESGRIFSSDAKRILAWSNNTAQLWDANIDDQKGILFSHEDRINGALFSSDDNRILTWSDDNTARIWNAYTGDQIGPNLSHDNRVKGAVFSFDDKLILTNSLDKTIRLWDADSGIQIGSSLTHDEYIDRAIFSSDAKRILTWGHDNAHLWDVETGVQIGPSLSHEGSIIGAIFSSDNNHILTWSYDNTARLWNGKTGVQTGSSLLHKQSVNGAIFSSDNKRILTWSYDNTAKLWDVETGNQIGSSLLHKQSVMGAIFSSDDKRILTWSNGQSTKLWDGETGEQIGSSLSLEGLVKGAIFSSDNKRVLTWSSDNTTRLWNTDTGDQIGPSLKGFVSGAVFSSNERRILTWGWKIARLWKTDTGEQIGLSLYHNGLRGALFSSDEKHILTWGSNTTQIWNAEVGLQESQLIIEKDEIRGAIFSSDNKRILTWSPNNAHLWDTDTGNQIGSSLIHDEYINGAIFSSDDKRILTWSDDYTARIWDADTGNQIGPSLSHDDGIRGAVFSSNDKRILTRSLDKTARLWNADTGDQIGLPLTHDRFVEGAVFSSDDKRILTWTYDNIRLWDAESGDHIGPSFSHDYGINGAVFSSDDKHILTWSDDNNARLWDAGSLDEPVLSFTHDKSVEGVLNSTDDKRILTLGEDNIAGFHDNSVEGALFSSDNKQILTWSDDNTARLWDADSGDQIGTSLTHDRRFNGATFSSDNKQILTWSDDNTARLWDASTSEQIGPSLTHKKAISGVIGATFSSDNKRILTWSGDKTARLWDAESGVQIGPSLKHNGAVGGAVFSSDEKCILTWSYDGTAHLWKLFLDGDFPISLYKKEIQTLTGTRYNILTNSIETLNKEEWEKIRKEYIKDAGEHYKSCKYPENNLFKKYNPEEAAKLKRKE